jgi:hypothetical protein
MNTLEVVTILDPTTGAPSEKRRVTIRSSGERDLSVVLTLGELRALIDTGDLVTRDQEEEGA